MLNSSSNSKDMVVTAIHNLDQMLDYAITVIMGSTQKFIQLCQILELVDLPYEARESQKSIINAVIRKMNSERAYD